MIAHEVNFDGLVGPTHSYAGLSYGNLASARHRHAASSPRQAALEGLAKMRLLARLGVRQAVLPPQERPDVGALRRLGFNGTDAEVLDRARRADPVLLHACSSASAMWAANAATVSPSADTADGRVHITPANLVSLLHRSLETETTARALRAIFADEAHFAHHPPLPASPALGDEGAANHTRLCGARDKAGVEVFTFGRSALGREPEPALRFPARQTLEASSALARSHLVHADRVVFVRQNPQAIDAGAFHNDVVCVGNGNVLLLHEQAFTEQRATLENIRRTFEAATGEPLFVLEAPADRIPLADAVRSYLFNSQLVTLPNGKMVLIAPAESREMPNVKAFVDELLAGDNPLAEAHYVDVRQSMNNGGGPACLRLRVVLTDAELARTNPAVLFTEMLDAALTDWVRRHYRDQLTPDDLADPKLLEEGRAALDELTRILGLGSLYPFQRG